MSRYIDKDAFVKSIKPIASKMSFGIQSDIANAIVSAPSIEIVRCKECKWAEPNREGDYDCKCHIPTFRIKANDFCSCGERREP
jgi:hypothetical protein